jgi:hypothetical protein
VNDPARDDGLARKFARLAEIAGDGSGCPSPETLWRSARAEFEPRENEAVVLHLGECTACAAAWRVARDLARESLERRARFLERRPVRRMWVPLAAAAALVVAVVGLTVVMRDRPGASPSYRTQEDEWLRPITAEGATVPRDDFVLRWTAGPEGTTYDVGVTTEDLRLLARETRLEAAELRVDVEQFSGLAPGTPIFWQVTAHLPDGRTVDSASFKVLLE